MTNINEIIADDDLDQLLDRKFHISVLLTSCLEALDAFQAPPPTTASTSKMAKSVKVSNDQQHSQPEEGLDQDFAEALAKGMEELLSQASGETAKGAGGTDNIAALMERLAMQQKDSSTSSATDGPKSFQDNLSETLSRLQQSSDKVQSELGASTGAEGGDMFEDMMKQLEQLPEGADFQSMLDSMLGELMSKDIMYEPLRDLADKYPSWLKVNKGKIADDHYQQYSKQYEYCLRILQVYEQDQPDAEQKALVAELMQKMQDCGSPPEGILKDLAPGLDFGANGAPKLPEGDMPECNQM
jgi:peroxin-19